MTGESHGERKLTPDVWGEPFWVAIHAVALGYPAEEHAPETERAAYRAFYESLAGVIPCSLCRGEYSAMLRSRPLEPALAGGRDALFRWTVDVHNEVAARIGKPSMTYRFVRDEYVFRGGRARDGSEAAADADAADVDAGTAWEGWLGAMLALLLVVGVVYAATRR